MRQGSSEWHKHTLKTGRRSESQRKNTEAFEGKLHNRSDCINALQEQHGEGVQIKAMYLVFLFDLISMTEEK